MVLFVIVLMLHCLTIVLGLCLLAFYIYHIMVMDHFSKEMKALWVVLVLLFGMIAMPVYWLLHIWREPPDPEAGPLVPVPRPAP